MNTVQSIINNLDFRSVAKLSTIVSEVRNSLDIIGYIIIKNYPIDYNNITETKRQFLALSEQIGVPISHDRHDTIIWDIKSNPSASSKNGVITYSEHNHEADLHTDSQYSEYPEDYFNLLTLRKAKCGGGVSYLLSLEDIVKELNSTGKGRKVKKILESTDYPFIVPNVFKKKTKPEPEFNFGPILRLNEIRFRVDTIEKALDYNLDFITKEQFEAFTFLVNLVRTTKNKKEFFLEENDLIFINNKTMLHGRGSFTDYDRHLLRIRMNKFEAVKNEVSN